MDDISKKLGVRIRRLRNEQGISQEELAYKSYISPAHLGQIERAQKKPTIETVAKISSALGVSLSTLFSFDSPQPPADGDPVINKILAQLADMTANERKDILKIIRIYKRAD